VSCERSLPPTTRARAFFPFGDSSLANAVDCVLLYFGPLLPTGPQKLSFFSARSPPHLSSVFLFVEREPLDGWRTLLFFSSSVSRTFNSLFFFSEKDQDSFFFFSFFFLEP